MLSANQEEPSGSRGQDRVANQSSEPIRVIVADDDSLARRIISDRLSDADIEIIAQVKNGEEAVEQALALHPDVIVMDLLMPRSDGITATRRIAAQAPDVQVVLLSVSSDEQVVMLALRSGAAGFLDKRLELDALARVVRGVSRGEAALDRTTTRQLIREFRAMAMRTEAKAAGSQLSGRERQVLELIAAGHSTEDISAELGLAVETVRTHVKAILRKLHVHSRQEAVAAARKRGLLVPSFHGMPGVADRQRVSDRCQDQ
ncbi:MAG TPA: response regulator transcription factor [Solirubrobacteraceae bacterium]|nr:response regulator transcription factor [Solirubrobacteraceae bacterium]